MRWLVHGNTTEAVDAALVRHGHTVQRPESVDLPAGAPPQEVYATAQEKQLDIVTNDPDLANAPFESPIEFGRTLVFLQLAGSEVEQDDAIDRLFARYKRLSPGRMYTVTETRVKIRQLPGRQ